MMLDMISSGTRIWLCQMSYKGGIYTVKYCGSVLVEGVEDHKKKEKKNKKTGILLRHTYVSQCTK